MEKDYDVELTSRERLGLLLKEARTKAKGNRAKNPRHGLKVGKNGSKIDYSLNSFSEMLSFPIFVVFPETVRTVSIRSKDGILQLRTTLPSRYSEDCSISL